MKTGQTLLALSTVGQSMPLLLWLQSHCLSHCKTPGWGARGILKPRSRGTSGTSFLFISACYKEGLATPFEIQAERPVRPCRGFGWCQHGRDAMLRSQRGPPCTSSRMRGICIDLILTERAMEGSCMSSDLITMNHPAANGPLITCVSRNHWTCSCRISTNNSFPVTLQDMGKRKRQLNVEGQGTTAAIAPGRSFQS